MVVWSKSACADLENMVAHFADCGRAEQGQQIATHISLAANRLVGFPLTGRRGRVRGTRELPVPNAPYLVIYALGDSHKVGIVRILPTDKFCPAPDRMTICGGKPYSRQISPPDDDLGPMRTGAFQV